MLHFHFERNSFQSVTESKHESSSLCMTYYKKGFQVEIYIYKGPHSILSSTSLSGERVELLKILSATIFLFSHAQKHTHNAIMHNSEHAKARKLHEKYTKPNALRTAVRRM